MFGCRDILVIELYETVLSKRNQQVYPGIFTWDKLGIGSVLTRIGACEGIVQSRGMLNNEILEGLINSSETANRSSSSKAAESEILNV